MSKRALIVIDLQNDYYPGGKWTLPDIESATDNAVRLLAAARKSGDKVVHIQHRAPAGAPFFVDGSEGMAINERVQPQGDEPVVVKEYANSFRETNLKAILDDAGITDLVICGAMSNNCVDAATRAAADFGYVCTVVHDACAASPLEFGGRKISAAEVHGSFMAALGFAYGKLLSTDEYLS
ncbi:MAG: cysteine hydrolase family protein [Myxococcota bacterium]